MHNKTISLKYPGDILDTITYGVMTLITKLTVAPASAAYKMVNVFLKTILACCNWPRSSARRAYRKRRPPRPLHYQRTYVTSTAINIFQNPQLAYNRTRDRRGGHEKTCRRDDSPRTLAPPTTLRDRRSVSGKSTSEAFNLGHCTRRDYMRRQRILYELTRIPVW